MPNKFGVIIFITLFSLLCACGEKAEIHYDGPIADWPAWGNKPGGGHYSTADQITPQNVHMLEQAWVYRSGDFREGGTGSIDEQPEGIAKLPLLASGFQATPIVENDTLYFCTPFNRVIALDPETGQERWAYDPKVDVNKETHTNCRGVSSWIDPLQPSVCAHRILTGTLDGRLIALDGKTGKPCTDFGAKGIVDLKEDLTPHTDVEYSVTSPPAIINDLVITGASIIDNYKLDVPSGAVRAYNIRTGKLEWYWDALPPDYQAKPEANGDLRFQNGTVNVWSIISVDKERNLVFLPTGNTSPDYYGGLRNGMDYYASSVVALNALTGKVVWHFQTVHHDIWDFDVPSQPTLYDIELNGKTVPALAQPTKAGHLFLLNRETGEPLFPVEERPVPQDPVAGEYLSPTQPFPTKPAPLYKSTITPEEAYGLTPLDRNYCKKKIASLRHDGIFTPPSLQGTINFPGASGSNNWGSPAIDPQRNLIVLNANQLIWEITLVPRKDCGDSGTPMLGTPYCEKLDLVRSPLSVPCNPPPWGTLTAVDLVSGEKRWEIPLGTSRDLAPFPVWWIKGSPTSGGPIVTKSGLVFIGGTTDFYFRAFSTETGKELWRHRLPTAAISVPMTYRLKKTSRQYVVVAVGGHWGFPLPAGDHLMAFALPESE